MGCRWGGYRKESVADATITTFFFTEFGLKWKARDLLFEFKDLGEVDEVVIPPRKDKRGRRYCFVRFLNVKDVNLMATKLDSMVLDGRKLFANLPRFQRSRRESEDQGGKFVKARREFAGDSKEGGSSGHCARAWVDKRSFVDVIKNKSATDARVSEDCGINIVVYSSSKEELERYNKAYIGVVKESGSVLNLKKTFHEEGLFTIRVTVLGPNLCLLEDLVMGDVEVFIEERREWWEALFSSIKPWSSKDVDAERFLWLRISGIPCHVWSEIFFKRLVDSCGVYISCDEIMEARLCMDEARILIKSGRMEHINVKIKAVIDGVSFSISLREDPSLKKVAVGCSSIDDVVSESSVSTFGADTDEMYGEVDRTGMEEAVTVGCSEPVLEKVQVENIVHKISPSDSSVDCSFFSRFEGDKLDRGGKVAGDSFHHKDLHGMVNPFQNH
ncbi:uncharacterized protein LOC131604238 [Vicia villosa]|uniref:uncharacterized protein LOC131604238 n=1 Tax=Vicia villosa TaxID=3911 RepID=UPI00273C0CF2|nr:uncharacterized protein LOC131604238 [Vicia villosa]